MRSYNVEVVGKKAIILGTSGNYGSCWCISHEEKDDLEKSLLQNRFVDMNFEFIDDLRMLKKRKFTMVT